MSAVADFLDRHTENCLLAVAGHGPHAASLIHGIGFNVPIPDPSQYDAIRAFCRDHRTIVYRPIPGKAVVLRCPDEETAGLAALML